MKKILNYKGLAFYCFFLSLCGFVGGIPTLLNPRSPLGLSTEMLKIGPFKTFLIPALALTFIIGLGNCVTGIIQLRKSRLAPWALGFMGAALIIFISVQVVVLQAIVFLHILFFSFGILQGLLALYELYARNYVQKNKKN